MSLISTPLTLPCGAILPNRLVKAAMTEGLADKHDRPTPALARLYERWSEGGAGVLITGNVMVDRRYLERGGNVVLEDDSALPQFEQWVKAGTKKGNHLWMQINHPGRQCARLVNSRPLSPSEVQLDLLANFGKPRALKGDEIEWIIKRFARTAALAKQAGFTGVQIHSAHGYLGSQFLSPLTNKRHDRWGGSLENRARFLLDTVEHVRSAVGPDYPVSVKLNSSDFQKGGFDLEECVQVVHWLAASGIDLLEISGGTYEQLAFMSPEGTAEIRESTRRREAYFLQYANVIKEALESAKHPIPLMVTGGFRTLSGMESALDAKETDLIGLGRPLCVDADFPNKLLDGTSTEAGDFQSGLVLGRGFWGNNSRSASIKAINNQGQAGWYYHQIERLARDKPADTKLGVLNAFCRHMLSDYRKVLRRKFT